MSEVPKVRTMPADRPIWFISDLHLGDGTPSDAFFGKDRYLLALLDRVDREGARLVIVGDAMDFHQAWSFTRILRAHGEVLNKMSALAREGRAVYVLGNHDWDLSLYREVLQLPVCERLEIGSEILVTHGYEYDPFHAGQDLAKDQWSTKIHHLVERYLQTWIRIPLGEFYTKANRFTFWGAHKAAVVAHAWCAFVALFGFTRSAEGLDKLLDFWVRSNLGDPMCMFEGVTKHLDEGKYRFIVCGHSHLPGIVRKGDKAYVNTGSWTFGSSQYARFDGKEFESRDWISSRRFGSELYAPVLDGSVARRDFWQWYDENYMGLWRFREGEERKGRARHWEGYVADHQRLSQLPEGER